MTTPTTISLTTFIPGVPAPQGSKTAVLRGRRPVLIEASRTTAPWRATVTAHVRQAMTGQINGPVRVACVFDFPRPASHFGTGRNAGLVRPSAPSIYKASKPDLDKLLRAVLDGVTDAGAWRDDSQVAHLSAVKRWADAETPGGGVHLTISELHDRTEVAS